MRIRRLIVATIAAAVLGTGVHAPRETRASDTAIIVTASVVGYFAILGGLVWYLRSRDSGFSESSVSPLLANDALLSQRRDAGRDRVRLGPDCLRPGHAPSLVCW